MDVLKRLFEQHFKSVPERVLPLQGQLGGSGRVIVRLAGAGSGRGHGDVFCSVAHHCARRLTGREASRGLGAEQLFAHHRQRFRWATLASS